MVILSSLFWHSSHTPQLIHFRAKIKRFAIVCTYIFRSHARARTRCLAELGQRFSDSHQLVPWYLQFRISIFKHFNIAFVGFAINLFHCTPLCLQFIYVSPLHRYTSTPQMVHLCITITPVLPPLKWYSKCSL